MKGAIIGDVVGSRFEFNNIRSTKFKLFTDDCFFTDDTVCTVAVADCIMDVVKHLVILMKWYLQNIYARGVVNIRIEDTVYHFLVGSQRTIMFPITVTVMVLRCEFRHALCFLVF
jgi:hypothetical protein